MFILAILSIVLALLARVHSQCCLQIQGRACLKCPTGTHMYRGNCIIDVDYCATYKDGFDCDTCNAGYQLVATGDCVVLPPPANAAIAAAGYTDEIIDPKVSATVSSDAYSLSVDYFKNIKPQLKTAEPIAAQIRTYRNLTV